MPNSEDNDTQDNDTQDNQPDLAEKTWFITGSSRGFGRALAEAALEAGDRVAATARDPKQLADLRETYGDRVLTLALDVTDPAAASAALDATKQAFGRIDVVVNNAGYANVAPIETADEEDFRRPFETNFWGVYTVSRAAVPLLREQGGGLIMQFSSVGGRVGGSPGIGSYQAAKFAVDGFSRVLAVETAPFGIRLLVVEPSGFATDWGGFLDAGRRHPRRLPADGRRDELADAAEHCRSRGRPGTRGRDPRSRRARRTSARCPATCCSA